MQQREVYQLQTSWYHMVRFLVSSLSMHDIFSVKHVPTESLMQIPNRINFQKITLGKLFQYEEIKIHYKHPLPHF